jgi:hypothetical protein
MRLWLVGMVVASGMAAVGGLLVGRATMIHLAHALGGARRPDARR